MGTLAVFDHYDNGNISGTGGKNWILTIHTQISPYERESEISHNRCDYNGNGPWNSLGTVSEKIG